MIKGLVADGCVCARFKGIAIERLITNGRVCVSYRIVRQGTITRRGITGALSVAIERVITCSRIVGALIEIERANSDRCIIRTSAIAVKGLGAIRRIPLAGYIVQKGLESRRSVRAASRITSERLAAHSGVPDAAGEIEQGGIALCCVVPRIASVGRWNDGVRFRHNPKCEEHEYHDDE